MGEIPDGHEVDPIEKPRGERWLEILGYGHLKGVPTAFEHDGQPVLTENFDVLCEKEVLPIFTALEAMSPDDPRYPLFLGAARAGFEAHFVRADADSQMGTV